MYIHIISKFVMQITTLPGHRPVLIVVIDVVAIAIMAVVVAICLDFCFVRLFRHPSHEKTKTHYGTV